MAGTDRDAKSRAMTERDKIKQRIAKLLNLTTNKGASEAEAMQSAERAAELMAHYDIQVSELQIKSARAVLKHAFSPPLRQPTDRCSDCSPHCRALRLQVLAQPRARIDVLRAADGRRSRRLPIRP